MSKPVWIEKIVFMIFQVYIYTHPIDTHTLMYIYLYNLYLYLYFYLYIYTWVFKHREGLEIATNNVPGLAECAHETGGPGAPGDGCV